MTTSKQITSHVGTVSNCVIQFLIATNASAKDAAEIKHQQRDHQQQLHLSSTSTLLVSNYLPDAGLEKTLLSFCSEIMPHTIMILQDHSCNKVNVLIH